MRVLFVGLIVAAVLVADQVSKRLIENLVDAHSPIHVLSHQEYSQ